MVGLMSLETQNIACEKSTENVDAVTSRVSALPAAEGPSSTVAIKGLSRTASATLRIVALVCVVVFAFMLAITFWLHPRYETVDDTLQAIVSSGMVYVFRPDDHLILVDAAHFLLGRVLNSLYSVQLDVPWYDLLQWGMLFVANVTFCSLIWLNHQGRRAVIPTVLYLIAVAAPSLTLLQMTTTTALFGIAGGALVVCALDVLSWSMTARVVSVTCGVVFIAFASLLRYEGSQLAMVLTSIYLVVRYFGAHWMKMATGFAALFVGFAAIQALHFLHTDYYERTGWTEFHEFGMQNRKLFDYGRANFAGNEKVLAQSGWTKNDLRLVKEQLFFCDTTFSASKINELAENCPRFMGLLRPDLARYLPREISFFFANPIVLIVLFAFATGFIIAGSMSAAMSTPRILSMMVLALTLNLAVTVIFKGSPHIYLPILYTVLTAQLIHLRSSELSIDKHLSQKRIIFTGLIVVGLQVLSWQAIVCHNKQSAEVAQHQAQNMQLIDYARTHKDKLFFPFLCVIEYAPFNSTRIFEDFKVVTSYSSRNPLGQAMLARFGLPDFKSGILSDKVLLISDRKRNRLVATFFKEHEGIEVRFEPLLVLDKAGKGIYKAVETR